MITSPFHSVIPLKQFKFLLLGIAAGLILIHLTLTWRSGDTDLLSTSIVLWIAVSFLLWKKRDILSLESKFFSSLFGILLITFVLNKSNYLSGFDLFLRISPFISALGLSLLASGIKGLKQYWQEMIIIVFLPLPPGLVFLFVDVPVLTAKFVAYVLMHLGFEVSCQGTKVMLLTKSVDVRQACSGIHVIIQLLGFAFLFLVIFPTNLKQKILVPTVAVLLGFVLNGVRVSLMAILVALSNRPAFEYWHTGNVSLMFSMLSGFIFWLFCLFMLRLNESEIKDSVDI